MWFKSLAKTASASPQDFSEKQKSFRLQTGLQETNNPPVE
jgi:hypothetical protein